MNINSDLLHFKHGSVELTAFLSREWDFCDNNTLFQTAQNSLLSQIILAKNILHCAFFLMQFNCICSCRKVFHCWFYAADRTIEQIKMSLYTNRCQQELLFTFMCLRITTVAVYRLRNMLCPNFCSLAPMQIFKSTFFS